MIPYKSNRLYEVPKTPEVRLEIAKAIQKLIEQGCMTKASADDPEHPEWPAGSPDGQGGKFRPKNGNAVVAANRMSPVEEADCMSQYERDSFICRLVRTRLCWEQAADRLAACLSGRQLPPLNF